MEDDLNGCGTAKGNLVILFLKTFCQLKYFLAATSSGCWTRLAVLFVGTVIPNNSGDWL